MSYKKPISVILSIGLILSVFLMPVSAYNLMGPKWSSSTINYYYDNYVAANAKNSIATSTSDWNNSNIDATLRFSASSYNVYCSNTNQPDVEWDGLTQSTYNTNTNRFVSQTLLLNSAKRAWDVSGALNSVACHEFGHVFGLDENGETATVMNSFTWGSNSRWEGYGISSPTSDDIRGVNSLY